MKVRFFVAGLTEKVRPVLCFLGEIKKLTKNIKKSVDKRKIRGYYVFNDKR